MAIKIFIDQGHNPTNPNAGAEGNGYREQDLVYTIGVRLAALFNANPETASRIKAYEKKYGAFQLKDGTLFGGGKTGTLGDATSGYIYSLVSYVTKGGRTYIAVTGETTLGHGVMADVKTLADNYIP